MQADQAEQLLAFSNPTIHGPLDAIAVRGERTRRNTIFGLYDPTTGASVPECDIQGSFFSATPETRYVPDEDPVTVDTPVLFAGLAPPQFGHVILNSLGRLWALDLLPSDTKLLFLPHRRPRLSLYSHLQPMLDLLGIKAQVILQGSPVRYSQLFTATDLFGERYAGLASPIYENWLSKRLPPIASPDPHKKIYVSRTGLGPQAGRFCNEDHLEHLLAQNGYDIFRPEQHSFSAQITTYQSAGHLIFAESSALHLFALIQQPNQRVGIIQRRPQLPDLLLSQLRPQTLQGFAPINAIEEIFWPPRRGDHLSVAVLDFEALGNALSEAELLPPNPIWQVPTKSAQSQSLNAGLSDGESLIADADREAWKRNLRQSRRQATTA